MTAITPSLLAAAYSSITVPGAPRTAPLTVIGIAAADVPPVTVADTVFPDNVSLPAETTLASAVTASAATAAAGMGLKGSATVFGSGANTASQVLGAILDITA